jgi:hypothetical protein
LSLLLLHQRAVGVFVKIMWLLHEFVLWQVNGELPYIFYGRAISGRWQMSSFGSSDFEHNILSNQCFLMDLNDTRAIITWRTNLWNPCTHFQWKVRCEIHRINGVPADSIPSLEHWGAWERGMKQVHTFSHH